MSYLKWNISPCELKSIIVQFEVMTPPRRVCYYLFLVLILFLAITLYFNIIAVERTSVKSGHKHTLDPLYEKIRILCMIAYNYNDPETAKYVKRTWGKHCNVLLFVSGKMDGELEPYVPVVNSTDKWTLVQRGLMHAYLFYGDEVDWVLRVEPSR